MDNQEERITDQSVEIHYMPGGVRDYEDLYFPIRHTQVRDILGKVLTQIEAMNLPASAEKANKAIFTQMLWRWFDEVMDNSATSSEGCIAPIKLANCKCDGANTGCSECAVEPPIKVFHFQK
jgi:hypothetical protein